MRKLVVIAFIASIVFSCSKDDPEVNGPDNRPVTYSRSISEAVGLANEFAATFTDSRAVTRIASDKDVKVISFPSRSGESGCIYAVNYEDENGFALVSSSYGGSPVLAFVENGSFNEAAAVANDGFSFFLENAMTYVVEADTFNPGPWIPRPQPYTLMEKSDPVLEVEWGQRYPEGLLYANKLAGCSQVAAAQILSYFEEPASISLSYPNHDINIQTLDWSVIKSHKKSVNSYSDYFVNSHLRTCPASEDEHMILARLCREIGYRSHAVDTSMTGTGAVPEVTREQMMKLLPNRHFSDMRSVSKWAHSYMYEQLKTGGIFFLVGWKVPEDPGAHSWVCEGGRHYEYHSGLQLIGGSEEIIHTYYFYYNWGWCGNNNGYFLGDVFDSDKYIKEEDLPKPTTPSLFGAPSRGDYKCDVIYFSIH